MIHLIRLAALALLVGILSGCIAELLVIDEVELAAVRGVARAGVAEAEASGAGVRLGRMGVAAEELNAFARATAEIRAGRLVPANEVAFNSQLGKIRLVRQGTENPRLFVRGAAEPFAEVLPHEGRIRLFNGDGIRLHGDIFSVERDVVLLRRNPSLSAGNLVATLHQGDLVIKLAESDGWYQVRIVQGGGELTGFIDARLLAAVALADSSDRGHDSPVKALAGEAEARWRYYWSAIGGNAVAEMTGRDAMEILYHDFGHLHVDRRSVFSEKDWPSSVRSFVRIEESNLPILSSNTFSDTSLRILGFTRAGELLQFVAFKDEWVKLSNPLDWGPKNYGEWYVIRTIDGRDGWIFTKPYGAARSSGVKIDRCDPASLQLTNGSGDSYRLFIDGAVVADMTGHVTRSIGGLAVGTHTVHAIQLTGYLFYATERTVAVRLTCGAVVTWRYP